MVQDKLLSEIGLNFVKVPISQILYFPSSVMTQNSRKDFEEVLIDEGFLSLGEIVQRLKYQEDDIEYVTFELLLNHFGVDYLELYTSKLDSLGWTRLVVMDILMPFIRAEDMEKGFEEVVERLSSIQGLIKKVAPVLDCFNSLSDLIKFYRIDFKPLLHRKKLKIYF